LRSGAASPEAVGFPLVAQVALLRRHLRQHTPEVVALRSSLPPSELTAAPWLAYTRAAWGIESGLHQRLDVSHREDAWPGASAQGDAADGDVAALQPQPLSGMALVAEEASTQDDHGFFGRHEGRALSLCVPLPSGPPTQPPNPFVNWPCHAGLRSEPGLATGLPVVTLVGPGKVLVLGLRQCASGQSRLLTRVR